MTLPNTDKDRFEKHEYSVRIRNKLTRIIIASTLVAVTLLSTWFVYLRYETFKTQMSSEFTTISHIIADRATAALVFEDTQSLQENLNSLALHHEIILGCIYSKRDRLLVQYSRHPSTHQCPNRSREQGSGFAKNAFQSLSDVTLIDEHVGRILVRASTGELYREILTTIVSTLLLGGLAILAALLFARHVQRNISDPLVDLQKLAIKVTEEKDYTLRAVKRDANEIGALVDAFNAMLATISQQNQIISQHAETLEHTVHERTRELEAAIKELEAFSYSVSHDLKAPLRSIRGFSELILEDYGRQLPDQGKHYLSRIIKNSDKMMRLVISLLELSRISRVELQRQTYSPNRMILNLLHDLKLHHPERSFSYKVLDGMLITGDEKMIESIFSNLISNAFKYSATRSHTHIEVGMREKQGMQWYFVRDEGIGFDSSEAERIFQPFCRLHAGEEFEGSGIGLATVARIVERHEGRIWAESTPGKGTSVYFSLYCQRHDCAEPIAPSAELISARKAGNSKTL